MKIIGLLLLLVSFNGFAQEVKAKAELHEGKPIVKWNYDKEFRYSVERRTNDSDYEMIATDLVNRAAFKDLNALPNTQYYYRVTAQSNELKLEVASVLVHTTDFSPGTGLESKNTNSSVSNGSINFKSCSFCKFGKSTGIKFVKGRMYSVVFTMGNVSGNGTISIKLGGNLNCVSLGSIAHMGQLANQTMTCTINPKTQEPKDSVFSDEVALYMGGNFDFTIHKIDIYEQE